MKHSIDDLKIGCTIKLLESGETFIINKIFPDGYVDMESTLPFNAELGLMFHEQFLSIKLKDFQIIKTL